MMIKINLMPWREDLHLQAQRNLKLIMFVGFSGGIIAIILWYMVIHWRINTATKQINSLQQQYNILKRQVALLKPPKAAKIIADLERRRFLLVQFFNCLQDNPEKNIYLTQLIIKKSDIKLFGGAESMAGVAVLINNLNKYSHVAVLEKITRQDEGYGFTILLAENNFFR
jgi:Tfp pilus assembly protein PilN